ncbi:MAG TPA: glycosyltransferase family 1 protein [Candidatus Angelobacter sp.]|jgi:glycosyltransferase involved in cell wall biosynthesis
MAEWPLRGIRAGSFCADPNKALRWSTTLLSQPMKIGIDVHSLGTQSGGNETYFRQLVRDLIRDQSSNQYHLFYSHRSALNDFQWDSRFSFSEIPANPVKRIGVSLPLQLRRTQPDIFHCQYIKPLFVKMRTVVTIHDLAHEHHPEFFHPLEALRMKKLVRWTAGHADHILTVSEFSAADIARRFGVSREKITVAYQAAAPDFRPRDAAQCKEHVAEKFGVRSPFILYVGRIQARKNLPRLVEAYARLRKQGIDAKLVMVGKKDWQSEQLLEKIKELNLSADVIFPGFVPFEDLPLFYNAAEVFVFPSIFEGFGLPVVESMASGVATITSFGSSLEEVAGNGALLVDPLDVGSIADALGKVLGDPGFRRELAGRGLRRSAQFKAGDMGAKALAVYQSLA